MTMVAAKTVARRVEEVRCQNRSIIAPVVATVFLVQSVRYAARCYIIGSPIPAGALGCTAKHQGEHVHADEQIDVQETEKETEVDIDLELSAPEADPAEGVQQTIDIEDLAASELRFAYRTAVRSRVMEEYFVRLVDRKSTRLNSSH
jgi:hypothetical protein